MLYYWWPKIQKYFIYFSLLSFTDKIHFKLFIMFTGNVLEEKLKGMKNINTMYT